MEAFNLHYSDLLRELHRAFNGEPERLLTAIGEMMQLRDFAHELIQLPSGDGLTTAGPSFELRPAAVGPQMDNRPFSITVRENGPYVVHGSTPLVRKAAIDSEWGEPLRWRKQDEIAADGAYLLCRCGQSSQKPF